jgi:hypothetical protein
MGSTSSAVNLVAVILFALRSPIAYAPAVFLSKLYANSMMVFLNDRIPSGPDCDGRAVSLKIVARPLDSVRFAKAPAPEDTAQELALESSDNASSTSGQTTVENPSK